MRTIITLPYKLVIFLILSAFLYSHINHMTWLMSDRVHSEFNWYTIKTDNFNVHYHEEIESIAIAGANIAEQVLPILLQQVNLDDTPIIDIILTTEDEIMNGFATPFNTTFIWVDQNDAAVWLEDQKWLEQVISHELQHIIYFNKIKTWLPEPYSVGVGDTPSWFVEGIAEYYTEEWRPYRSEINHRFHTLKNSTSSMDPHHDGFSKIKLMAQTYGDSSIVKLLEYRNKYKLFNFEKAFKEATGVKVDKFNDFWRRTINTYYYGTRSQKETYEDAGDVFTLPISKLGSLTSGFRFSSDSMHIAMVGTDEEERNYLSMIIASVDTTISNDENESKEEANKIKFNKKEIDYGRFHNFFSWSKKNEYLVYSKYHYANNSSRVFDLCLYDFKNDKKKWITNNLRATYPIFSGDNNIIFVAHENSTSNLYMIDINDISDVEQLTFFRDDIQILSPSISKDEDKLIFGMSNQDANLDIYLLNLITNDVSRKTFDKSVDYMPIFDSEDNIIFTSHRTGTPNLFKLDKNNSVIQMTDLPEGAWSAQLDPIDSYIMANTLNDVDSTRIVKINPNKIATSSNISINERFSKWKSQTPIQKIDFTDIKRDKIDYSRSIEKYNPLKNIRHLFSTVLPLPGIIVNTNWADRIGRNIFNLSAGTYNYTFKDVYKRFPPEFFIFGYINAYKGPHWGFNYFYNSNFIAKFYDKGSLIEGKDGFHVWSRYPYNNGKNDYANHLLELQLESSQRKTNIFYDSLLIEDEENLGDSIYVVDRYNLPTPENGQDNSITLNYKFLSKKPLSDNWFLPSQGMGIQAEIVIGQKTWDLYYQKFALDSYFNYKIKMFTLYSRFKIESVYGQVFSQDKVWFSQDKPIYISGQRGGNIFGENLSPRGWRDDSGISGDQMIFSTIEIRHPLPIALPIDVLGTKLGESSIALFQDYGMINKVSVHTLGYEAKISILNSNQPILFLSYGESQTLDRWVNMKKPYQYIQMSLINPF